MRKNSSQIAMFATVIVILAAALAVFVILGKVNELGKVIVADRNHEYTESLAQTLSSYDYTVYYLGEYPSELELISDHITTIETYQVTEDYMPVIWNEVHMIEYDEAGNKIQDIKPRDYSLNMIIVVDDSFELTESNLSILQNCAVLNGVPVLIMGDTNINAFRDELILGHRSYGDNGSMLFANGEASEGPLFDPENSRGQADSLMELMLELFELSTEITEET